MAKTIYFFDRRITKTVSKSYDLGAEIKNNRNNNLVNTIQL